MSILSLITGRTHAHTVNAQNRRVIQETVTRLYGTKEPVQHNRLRLPSRFMRQNSRLQTRTPRLLSSLRLHSER